MPNFLPKWIPKWPVTKRSEQTTAESAQAVEPDDHRSMQPDKTRWGEDDVDEPERRRWGKREAQLICYLYEALCSWPLFLHLVWILSMVWLTGFMRYNYPLVVFTAIFYLHKVDNVQKERLRIQIQNRMDERRSRLLLSTDAETVIWLNAILQECWPSWLERYLSHLIMNCLHLNLAYYKPRALSKLVIDFLRLGSSPPVIQFAKVHRNPNAPRGEQAVLELDISFVAADDMKLELIARLKKASMGLGLAGKLYGNNLRVEGKLRLGFTFVPFYPYIGQLTVAFASIPVLGLSVRPLSTSSVDVTDLPGIASWVSKAIQAALETFLVEPHPLVLDMIKLCGADYRFDIDKDGTYARGKSRLGNMKEPKDVGFVILEILECKDLEAKDRTGFPDPYVKISLEKVKFKTSVKKQTLHPIWHELFRLRINSWQTPTKVLLRVRDRDAFGKDDELGCSELDINQLRGGKRHDMWLRLRGAKSGQIHLAVTIVDITSRASTDYEEGSSSSTGDASCMLDRDNRIDEHGLRAQAKNVRAPYSSSDGDTNAVDDQMLRKKMKHVRVGSVDSDRFEPIFDSKGNPTLEKESQFQNGSTSCPSALPRVEEKPTSHWETDPTRKTPKRRTFMFLRQRTPTVPKDKDEKTFPMCLGGKQSSPSKGRMNLKALYKRMAAEFRPAQDIPAVLCEIPIGNSSELYGEEGKVPLKE